MAAASAGFIFLLDRAALGSPIRFRVLFRHSAGLHDHAPLVIAGTPIGRVEAISPVLHGAPGPLAGEVGVAALVEIRGGDAWKVPANATIFVASRGPLSDRYLEVAPPTGTGEPGPAIRDGAELRGVDPPTLDNVLQHTWNNLLTFQQFVDTVRPELAALRTQLDQLRDHWIALAGDLRATGGITALIDAVRGLIAAATRTRDTALGGRAGIPRLLATAREARRAIAESRAALDLLGPELAAVTANLTQIRGHIAASDPIGRADQLLTGLRSALDRIDPLLAAATDLGDRIARGEGTIGRIASDPEFPEDTKELGKLIKRHPWKILERPPN
ncbi:MAG: MCE family protein [Deltaproteobacteria bacterium]|nr:MAG: MCE family protein [Deltaproteobacteria bacterium]